MQRFLTFSFSFGFLIFCGAIRGPTNRRERVQAMTLVETIRVLLTLRTAATLVCIFGTVSNEMSLCTMGECPVGASTGYAIEIGWSQVSEWLRVAGHFPQSDTASQIAKFLTQIVHPTLVTIEAGR
eukprot:m.1114408 g.1114408  ORF g.1114408 m.1114408 type:complete len:126 (+) comp24366_c0_seq24:55-432(+)